MFMNPIETKSPQTQFFIGCGLVVYGGTNINNCAVFAFQKIIKDLKSESLLKTAHSYHLQAFENHFLVMFKSKSLMVYDIDDRSDKT